MKTHTTTEKHKPITVIALPTLPRMNREGGKGCATKPFAKYTCNADDVGRDLARDVQGHKDSKCDFTAKCDANKADSKNHQDYQCVNGDVPVRAYL